VRSDDPTSPERDPIEVFLSQPAEVADEDRPEPRSTDAMAMDRPPESNVGLWRRFAHRLTHFMFEKEPSKYSSIAPRRADGTRSKIFWFNGNGRGR
jgi:hypothetical protein